MTYRNDIEQLFKEHFAQMHRLAVVLLNDDDLARDIVHDVFTTILEGEPGIAVSAGYLMRAVRNRCLNHIRNCNIHQRVASRILLENEEYDSEHWPDEKTITRIYDVISSELSLQEQTVIRLRFFCGLHLSEVVAEMGISKTAVYKHLRHALLLIRKKLNQDGEV